LRGRSVLSILSRAVLADEEQQRGVAMAVVAGPRTVAGAEVRTGARPTRGRTSPKTKGALVVAVSLLVLAALAALLPASEAPNDAEHSSSSAARSTPDRSGAAAPVFSEPQAAAPQHMSEREALDAYEKPFLFDPLHREGF
jgi:hypothetical protein